MVAYIGTSGFAYKEWKGPLYPKDLKDADMLTAYAGRFGAVEINYTFRRFPSAATLTRWADRTPETFRFALKAFQGITHRRRLADADEQVSDFLEICKALGPRLGPILFQCPPSLHYDRALIERFVGYLPPTYRYAMEFRHPSWEAAKDLLAAQGVAWCVAETDEGGAVSPVAEPFGYLRLRKDVYEQEELGRWAAWIERQTAAGRDVFAFFKHESGAVAPDHATRLTAALGPA